MLHVPAKVRHGVVCLARPNEVLVCKGIAASCPETQQYSLYKLYPSKYISKHNLACLLMIREQFAWPLKKGKLHLLHKCVTVGHLIARPERFWVEYRAWGVNRFL